LGRAALARASRSVERILNMMASDLCGPSRVTRKRAAR
jgi:hypothetical protein